MPFIVSADRFRILFNRFRQRLWVKPLLAALLSVGSVVLARMADNTGFGEWAPQISDESIEGTLSIMAASMLVIATFAVASMVSAFASAGSTATPRSFSLVIADNVSQNALSTFIGAFIFSVVALTAFKNSFFGPAGVFTIFSFTIVVFTVVILIFVRWVDNIARLGRLGTTIDKVERAAADAIERRRNAPTLRGRQAPAVAPSGEPLYAESAGYVQHVDVAALQKAAEKGDGDITVAALPGTFAAPGRPLAYVRDADSRVDRERVLKAFSIGDNRQFQDDPRFGLVVLSEIAGRALSPAVNDPGTAIDIIGTLVRLFVMSSEPPAANADEVEPFDRVYVPPVSQQDMFDDAFTAIARDGAGSIEVALRLQKALQSLALVGHPAMRDAALQHSRSALARALHSLTFEGDRELVRSAAAFAQPLEDSVATSISRPGLL